MRFSAVPGFSLYSSRLKLRVMPFWLFENIRAFYERLRPAKEWSTGLLPNKVVGVVYRWIFLTDWGST
jgi:hypothetical protein